MSTDSIILSSCVFGSVYLFSQSLDLINRSYKYNETPNTKLLFINGLTLFVSGSIFVSSNLYYFRLRR
jgi:hypothetical protein